MLLEFLDLEWEQNFLDAMQNLFNAPFACIIWVAVVLYRLGTCAQSSNQSAALFTLCSFSFVGFMKTLELPPGTD